MNRYMIIAISLLLTICGSAQILARGGHGGGSRHSGGGSRHSGSGHHGSYGGHRGGYGGWGYGAAGLGLGLGLGYPYYGNSTVVYENDDTTPYYDDEVYVE